MNSQITVESLEGYDEPNIDGWDYYTVHRKDRGTLSYVDKIRVPHGQDPVQFFVPMIGGTVPWGSDEYVLIQAEPCPSNGGAPHSWRFSSERNVSYCRHCFTTDNTD